tara:strand:- start:58 stop:231 length:174 start_codon:yes stop_codon:yes gene_type:complete
MNHEVTNLTIAFDKLKELEITPFVEMELYSILGDLARAEYSQGCKTTRDQLLEINQN